VDLIDDQIFTYRKTNKKNHQSFFFFFLKRIQYAVLSKIKKALVENLEILSSGYDIE